MQSQSSRPRLSRAVAPGCPPPTPGSPSAGHRGARLLQGPECPPRCVPLSGWLGDIPPQPCTGGASSCWGHTRRWDRLSWGAPLRAPEVPSLLGLPLPGTASSPGVPGANYPNGRRLARGGRYSLIQFTLKCNLIFREAGGQPPAHPATFPPLQRSLLPALHLFPFPPRHGEEPFSTGIPSPPALQP